MSEQEPVTAPTPAEPEAPATPPVEEPKAEALRAEAPQPEPQPEPKPEPDWRAAYVGLQTNLNKAHARNEDLLRQQSAIAQALKEVKETQGLLARQSLGEDQAKELEARQQQASERAAALQAAQDAQQLITGQAGLFLETLKEAGVDPLDPSIDWAKDAADVREWTSRVGPSVKAALRKANEERIRKYEEGAKARSQKEVQAEAEALAQRQLKEAGVDKIDTARGSGPTSLADRIRDMDPNSPEFAKFYSDVLAGRMTK